MNMSNRSPIQSSKSASGFTLIEVLIAILVLAIGMLGLGAIFPAVIIVQRDAFAVIEGENVASSAEALISNREFIDFSLISSDFNRPLRLPLPALGDPIPGYAYEWVVPAFGATYPSNFGGSGWVSPVPGFTDLSGNAADFVGSETGLWSFNSNQSALSPFTTDPPDRRLAQIPVSARLFPQAYSGKDPRFVWDLALRREPAGDRLQAAIFVRRIDARLRVPKGFSLSDVLTDSGLTPMSDGALLPVAINKLNGRIGPDTGASDDMVYASIQVLNVEVHPEHLDWLIFPDGRGGFTDTSVGFAVKVGQKLLDNTGVVRTVVGMPSVDPNDSIISEVTGQNRVVQVDPPFLFRNAGGRDTDDSRSDSGNTTDSTFDSQRTSWVRQVIFTPRTPVTIRLVTLEESR